MSGLDDPWGSLPVRDILGMWGGARAGGLSGEGLVAVTAVSQKGQSWGALRGHGGILGCPGQG